MGSKFTVRVLKNCAICGDLLPKRFRSYCSTICRQKRNNLKNKDYQQKWSRKKRGEYSEGKKKCAICEGWYVQVGSHVIQRHQYETAREYREDNNLPLKSGITPEWFRELKAQRVFENGTVNNLKSGKKFWYKKGDPRAIEVTGFKGRHAKTSEYY